MFSLSTRAKEAIKTALAMTLVYGFSLRLGWDNPYWAGFAVAMISLSTVGQSLNKGTLRILGTLVAVVVSLTIIALFIQERWWFVAVLSVYLGFCTYMVTGKKLQYFWWCSAFVVLVICVHAASDVPNAFNTAVLRVQQTGMGIVVYTLVSVLLWPSNTRSALEGSARKLFATQADLYRAYLDLSRGRGTAEESRPARMREVQLLGQCEQALRAATTDTYEVWEIRDRWWRFHHQSTALAQALEHWRESFAETRSLDREALMPNLEVVRTELSLRFEAIERMLAGEAPLHAPQPVTLEVDRAATQGLSHFQKAAVALNKTWIDRIEVISRSLFDCVREIKDLDRQARIAPPQATRSGGAGLDPDRSLSAFRAMTAVWVGFLVWFYLDPPGHAGFVEMVCIFTMAAAWNNIDPATMVKPFLVSALFAGVLYIFVMPHLSGFVELGAMIFGATFLIYYLFWEPRQGLAKMAGIVQFLNVIGVQNEQTYDFASYANTALMLALAGAVAITITYIPPSPRPEKVFLRLLARYFRQGEHLLSRMALDWEQTKGIGGRWKTLIYRASLPELPQKLASWGAKIDQRAFPDNSPEQVQALVTALQALAFRLEALSAALEYPQADRLVRELLDDVRAWRLVAQEALRRWAEDPATALSSSVEMQERLEARLARLEARVEETFSEAGEELGAEDYENFYRVLGAYRGLSEAGINYARAAETVDWARWQEARF